MRSSGSDTYFQFGEYLIPMAEVTGIKRKGEVSAYSIDFCHTNRAASFWITETLEFTYIFPNYKGETSEKLTMPLFELIWKLSIVFL